MKFKTAKEWLSSISISNHPCDCVCQQCKNGYECFITPDMLEQRDKQIRQQALDEAIEVAENVIAPEFSSHYKLGANMVAVALKTLRDKDVI